MSAEDSVERAERAVQSLDAQEEVAAADLEDVRQALPTEPAQARVVQAALPYPWSEVFEYVEGSERQAAYWRTRPDRQQDYSEADREAKERFAAAAAAARGKSGTTEYKGGEVPASAAAVAEAVAGSRGGRRLASAGRKALSRLRDVLGVEDTTHGE